MKWKVAILSVLLAGLMLMAGPALAWRGSPGAVNTTTPTTTDYYSAPSAEEIAGLQYMVEEEKLARDVYLYLYDQWGVQIFSNIADSEQTHMDMVASLLDKYDLENPAADEAPGEFQNPELQELYNKLTEMGSQSLEDAYKVGALIEEVDIKDLEERISQSDNDDINQVYANLMAGSENHLRAFAGQLENMGVNYTAQVLPQEQVDEILSSTPSHGMGYGQGGGYMQDNTTQDEGILGYIYRFMNSIRNAFQHMIGAIPI